MVQLHVLSGKKNGTRVSIRKFPFRIGRAPGNHLQLDDDGVWDRHAAIQIKRKEGFYIAAATDALVTVNNARVDTTPLRVGDIFTVGSARVQFWLTPPRQRGLRVRETFVWAVIALVSLAQVALVYWLVS